MNNNKNKATKQFPIVSISRDFLRDIFDPQEDPKAHNRVESLTDEDMEDLVREMRFLCTPKSFVDVLRDLFESMFMVGETEEGNKSKELRPEPPTNCIDTGRPSREHPLDPTHYVSEEVGRLSNSHVTIPTELPAEEIKVGDTVYTTNYKTDRVTEGTVISTNHINKQFINAILVKNKPTCPTCSKQITWLKNWQSGKEGWEFSLDKDNDPDYPQQIDFTGDNNTNDYDCPECDETLFTNEEEATAFLKGETKQ